MKKQAEQNIPPNVDRKKIMNLVNKAILSTSLRDKNEVLTEIRDIWQEDNAALESILQSNSLKETELALKKKQQAELIHKMETLKTNTSFYKYFNPSTILNNKELLIQSIKAKEEIISKYQILGSAELLQESFERHKSPDELLFSLMDINFRRSEEVAHVFKKRLNNVEESQESSDYITKTYGSVTNLLNVLHELEEINKKLKEGESVFIDDVFVCRQRLSTFSPLLSRLYLNIYSTLLNNYLLFLSEIRQFEKVKTSNLPDFDEFCSDPLFSLDASDIDIVELGKSLETDEPLTNPKSLPEKLSMMKEIIKLTNQLNNKLEQDIEKCIKVTKPPPEHKTPTHLEKLAYENYRNLEKVRNYELQLDDLLSANSDLCSQIIRVMKYNQFISNDYIHLLDSYRKLVDDQIKMAYRQNQNRTSLKSLIYLISEFGLTKLGSQLRNSDQTIKFFNQLSKKESERLKTLNPEPMILEQKPVVEEKKIEIHDPKFMMQLMMLKKKKHSRLPSQAQSGTTTGREYTELEELITERLSQRAHVHQPLPQPIQQPEIQPKNPTEIKYFNDSNKMEIIHGLAKAFQLGGFTIGSNQDFYKIIHNESNSILTDLSSSSHQIIEDFQQVFNMNFSQINYFANRILVKEKHQISIQTVKIENPDIETQTEQIVQVKAKKK